MFASLPPLARQIVRTPFGSVEVMTGDVTILLRHQGNTPPHRINFCANMAALAILGVENIVAFGSSGSLKEEIKPGSILIPDDYMSMSDIPSIHNHAISHVMPVISKHLISELGSMFPDAQVGGTYVQTRGPRIETIAEVKTLAKFADIVGMTVASEATLACELEMEFAALCMVDNYANGLGTEVLSFGHIVETARVFRERTDGMVRTIIEKMG
ncbi:MAG: MTAP family purine nucleoside phosphorylase [Methanoregulaceae archaeon]|nr:MTAP family purine nucleoside phosphorylase [Methanoregulaceae archaeon]